MHEHLFGRQYTDMAPNPDLHIQWISCTEISLSSISVLILLVQGWVDCNDLTLSGLSLESELLKEDPQSAFTILLV